MAEFSSQRCSVLRRAFFPSTLVGSRWRKASSPGLILALRTTSIKCKKWATGATEAKCLILHRADGSFQRFYFINETCCLVFERGAHVASVGAPRCGPSCLEHSSLRVYPTSPYLEKKTNSVGMPARRAAPVVDTVGTTRSAAASRGRTARSTARRAVQTALPDQDRHQCGYKQARDNRNRQMTYRL